MPPDQTTLDPQSGQTTLDPQAVNLAKAIRAVETQGQTDPFTAKGSSGEYGAYQWTEPTWNKMAAQFGITAPLKQSTKLQQNEVAYRQVKTWKDQGYNVGQIASMWNAGESEPNAYQGTFSDGSSSTGVNKRGIKFDVPSHAKSVATAYQALKENQSTAGITSLSTVGAQPMPQAPQGQEKGFFGNLFSGDLTGAGKNLLDFAFPIIGDLVNDIHGENQKTALQQLGDAGLSALWFVPFVGPEAGFLARVGAGATLGYGADIASKLSQGQTDAGELLTPGFGTLTGGAAGGILPKLVGFAKRNFTQEGALKAIEGNLGKAIGAARGGHKFLAASASQGFNPSKFLAESLNIPDIVEGKFSVADNQANVRTRIAQLGKARAEVLDSIGSITPLEDFRKEVLAEVSKFKAFGETNKMANQINSIFDNFKMNYGENLSASELEKIKEAQAASSRIYKRAGQVGEQNASSIIGNVSRTKIETLADRAGFEGMNEYNNYIKAHYNALEALGKIEGQVVKGGRLTNILRGHTIGGVSAIAASAIGGGWPGIFASFLVGEGTGKLISKFLADTSFSNPLRDKVLQRIAQENPDIVNRLLNFVGQKGIITPIAAPKISRTMGLLPKLLQTTAVRGGVSLNP